MDKIKLVCVSCRNVDPGDGKWLTPNHQIVGELQDSLCPDCCHQRFPQFYSDFIKPSKQKLKWLSFLPNLLES
jgi:hypothetical protein